MKIAVAEVGTAIAASATMLAIFGECRTPRP
jgi:hypothetical protein